MNKAIYNWQLKGWPRISVDRTALRAELKDFAKAFNALKRLVDAALDPALTAETLTDEAVTTSAIEGVRVDESAVMSSICRALGVATPPMHFTKDVRATGVAEMMLSVRKDWQTPVSVPLIRRWHAVLMSGDTDRVAAGAFRKESVFVVRRRADGTQEIRFEAPPSARVPQEIARLVREWKPCAATPERTALRAALMHPQFESIHPFQDGNGRVGRALVAKVLAEGFGVPLILPVSTIIARHRAAYYDELNEASRTLDWTNWCAFFIPVLTEMLTSFMSAAILPVGAGPAARYALNGDFSHEPIEPLNEPLNQNILKLVKTHPGVKVPYLHSVVSASRATVKRMVKALMEEGRIEHRGSKKTGGYYLKCKV